MLNLISKNQKISTNITLVRLAPGIMFSERKICLFEIWFIFIWKISSSLNCTRTPPSLYIRGISSIVFPLHAWGVTLIRFRVPSSLDNLLIIVADWRFTDFFSCWHQQQVQILLICKTLLLTPISYKLFYMHELYNILTRSKRLWKRIFWSFWSSCLV